MNILIVEDSATLRYAMRQFIERAGHSAIIAANGEQALQTFETQAIDMVIMDVEMPGLDGFDTTRIMRDLLNQDDIWIPIIFVTGKNDENDLRRGIEVGGDDYLIKPVSETILIAKIRAMERIMVMRDELKRLNQSLLELSERDSLTHLYNRRTFDDRANSMWKQAARDGTPLSILLMDIDHFKLYNDFYGHLAGDECIQQVANALQLGLSRPGDLLARYGGEEFIALLPNTQEEGARHVAERLRRDIANLNITHRESSTAPHITLSIGGATVINTAGSELKCQIHAADQALYVSKQGGRNQTTIKIYSPKVKILIADREGGLDRLIEPRLKQFVGIIHARSASETVTQAEQNRPDAIVLHENIHRDIGDLSQLLRLNSNTALIPQMIVTSERELVCADGDGEKCFAQEESATALVEELNRVLF